MNIKKKLLFIATGGTIASQNTKEGLAPGLTSQELLSFVPGAEDFCQVHAVSPFQLDSTNVCCRHWLALCALIRQHYEEYDGFVISHGTDTMAYTAAALSYLIQNSPKPVVITGSQKPIDRDVTDARTNLLDALRFASHPRAHGVNIVFGGNVIAGTRAKKERSKSYHAFSSINYPLIAVIQENRIIFYIDDKPKLPQTAVFYETMNPRVFLYKLIPGSSGAILDALFDRFDALIIESFGVGGLPDYGDDGFFLSIRRWVRAGKPVVMATQVTHEGSDMGIYQVGQYMKRSLGLPESFDMTLEATVAKTMWALAQSKTPQEFQSLFYTTVNRDLLFL